MLTLCVVGKAIRDRWRCRRMVPNMLKGWLVLEVRWDHSRFLGMAGSYIVIVVIIIIIPLAVKISGTFVLAGSAIL